MSEPTPQELLAQLVGQATGDPVSFVDKVLDDETLVDALAGIEHYHDRLYGKLIIALDQIKPKVVGLSIFKKTVSKRAAKLNGHPLSEEAEVDPQQALLDELEQIVEGADDRINDLAGILDELVGYFSRWVWFPVYPAGPRMLALWTLHTYKIDAFQYSPRVIFRAPTKRSGKTTGLKLLNRVVFNSPGIEILTTAASVFRSLAEERLTLLIDEIDALFGPRAAGGEDLRGVINHGFEADGIVRRNVPDPKKGYRVEQFPAFCSMALSGIGRLPETIEDRSIIVALKPKGQGQVERYNSRRVKRIGGELRGLIGAWINRHGKRLERPEEYEPDFPQALDSRAADCWEPLFIVAETAGGDWPERAREAAIEMSGYRDVLAKDGDALELLSDVRDIFNAFKEDALWTRTIVLSLCKMDEAPWSEMKLNGHVLGRMLREFDIRSGQVWRENVNRRGYERADFESTWALYLPDLKATDSDGENGANLHDPSEDTSDC